MNTQNDFPLPQHGYLAFDALSMKAFLKQRLDDAGVFTDQNYEGSNISQVVDLFAYTFHTLIYYMNKTASEGLFSDAQIYENINRITKAMGYNPIGCQTSVLSFKGSCVSLDEITPYIIPRYSNVSVGGKSYSVPSDISFISKTLLNEEYITDFSTAPLLYEGLYKQYEKQYAVGVDNELIFLNPGQNISIDHFTIDVYVKTKSNGKWSMWTKTPSLYLNNASDQVYEIRLSEKKHYEIRFGNDIGGKRLSEGDEIQIYYIESSGSSGVVGAGALNGLSLIPHSNDTYDEIMADIRSPSISTKILSYSDINYFKLYNDSSSTYYTPEETVEDIRFNAPGIYRSQYRLTTAKDFETFILTNFSNLIHDVSVVNNWTYLSGYIRYFYDRGLKNPNDDSRVLMNQVMYADACNFNNVYVFAIPKIPSSDTIKLNYLNPALKSSIIQSMDMYKVLTTEPIILDAMYMGFSFALPEKGSGVTVKDIKNTKLVVVRKLNSRRDGASIKAEVAEFIKNYFSLQNAKIGQDINITALVSNILAIDGVQSIYTVKTDDEKNRFNGLSLIKFNPIYPSDSTQITTNITLEPFQFPYFSNQSNLSDNIEVFTSKTAFEEVEY